MKQAASYNLSEMTCSQCNHAFDLDIILLPGGKIQSYLQCWNCLRSLPISEIPSPEILVESFTFIIRKKIQKNQIQTQGEFQHG